MILAISSKQFSFERAQAWVVPSNWDSPSNLARGYPEVLLEPIEVVDDHTASVDLPGPGEFLLVLSKLTARRFKDNLRFQVPWFATNFHLTDADIQLDHATVFPNGVFRASIFNRAHRPLRGRKLVLSGNGMTASFVTDENGAVLFLGNAFLGNLTEFGTDTETIKVVIESL